MEGQVIETKTIDCVAFFYREGAKGDDFLQKNKFRCCVDSSKWKSVVKLREHVREFAGLSMTAKELGLGDHVIIKLNRGSRVSGRQERYSIETDSQLQLEMPSILSGVDKLLLIVYPVRLMFSKKTPKIVITTSPTKQSETGSPSQVSPGPTASKQLKDKVISEEELEKLNNELQELDGSKVVISSTKTTARFKGQIITWPYYIKCGLCSLKTQVCVDRRHNGIITKFKTAHYKRLAPTTTEGEVECLTNQTPRKKHKAAGDSDVDNSDRETE